MNRTHFFGARGLGAALLTAMASMLGTTGARADVVDEVKAGVLAHDVGLLGDHVEGGADITGEVLFASPQFLAPIGAPRPTLGASVNTAGKTDYLYADLTWTGTLWHPMLRPQDGVYVGGALGGAVHDGRLNQSVDDDKPLGTRALFHVGVELGYQISAANSVEIYLDHLSNADTSTHNPGLNNIGLRTGFKF